MVALLIDGMLSGTGMRDAVNGGYIAPDALGLSGQLLHDLGAWHAAYENAHFDGFPSNVVAVLDIEGLALAQRVDAELANTSVGYFSDGLMKRLA